MSSKKSKANTANTTEVITETVNEVIASTPTVENTNEGKKTPGRPVDMNSARQQRLVDIEMKKMLNGGAVKRGRPTNPDSDRQKKLSNKTPGLKPGRPKMSEEQKAENERLRNEHKKAEAERIANVAREKLIAAGLWNSETNAVNEGVTKDQIKAVLTAPETTVEAA